METPIPNYSILPVMGADLHMLANFVHSSKLPLTINRLLFKDWPNDVAQIPLYIQAVESAFRDPSVDCLKVVDNKSADIIGYLAVTRKRPANIEPGNDKDSGDRKQNIPDGIEPDVFTAVGKAMTEITEEMKGIDHLEVTYICVTPSRRRQGIGSQLIQVCTDKAKAEGIPLAVCSEPAAHEFFDKRGFRDTRHVDIDLSKWAPAYSGFGIFRLAGMVWSIDSSNS